MIETSSPLAGAPAARRLPVLPPPRLLGALIALTLVRLIVAGWAGLVDDEAYYRLWSLSLAFGYYDHAPFVAWMIRAGRSIAGDTSLGVRLFAPLLVLAGSLLLWRTAAVLYDRARASIAVAWFNAAILIGAGAVLVTPDTPSVFFWGATLWALAELDRSRNAEWWLAVGLFAGLGLLSKYSCLFLGAGIVIWLVWRPENRIWFRAWQLWAGGALALALFAPVVAWNAAHQWISFEKQFGRAVPHGFTIAPLFELLGAQWALVGLATAPFAVWGARIAFRAKSEDPVGRAALLPLATSLPFAAYLVFHCFHGSVEANWPAPLYPAAILLAVLPLDRIGRLGDRSRRLFTHLARAVLPLGAGVTALLYLHVSFPLLVLPPARDPTSQMRGWDGFAQAVGKRREEAGATWIATPTYALTGQLMLHLGSDGVAQLDERARYGFLAPPDTARIAGPALFVVRANRDRIADFADRFETVERLADLDRTAGGRVIETYALYRLSGPKGAVLGPDGPAPKR